MLLWSVGEVLWDVFPDQERLGGAPLNLCANLQRLGDLCVLFSAVGKDQRGSLALDKMRLLGLKTEHVLEVDRVATGVALVTTAANGESEYSIPRPAAFDRLSVKPASLAESEALQVEWLYFGTLTQIDPANEAFVTNLTERLVQARVFYDMNLRTGHWNLALVKRLSRLATIVKMNEFEAETLFKLEQNAADTFKLEEFCRAWASEYRIDVICVTLGSAGCLVYDRGTISRVPGFKVQVRDTVGAGDAFAAAFVHSYNACRTVPQSAKFANALGALVASRAGATPAWTIDELMAIFEGT